MKIASARLFAYSLPLHEPLRTARGVMDRRDGWLVEVVGDAGATGWGDIAPLPGFSVESASAARDDARRAVRALPGMTVDPLSPWSIVLPGATCASVRFGVESAVTMCAAQTRGTSPAALWGAGETRRIAINALAAGDIEGRVAEAHRAGFATVKVKVGRRAPADDAASCRTLRRFTDEGMTIRFDANRAWTVAQTREFVAALQGLPFAYIEEPLADASGLRELADGELVPVALDESIADGRFAEWSTLPNVRALVLKPTILGGLAVALRIARDAVARGQAVVVSSAFESGVGLRMLAELAALAPDTAAGLDTGRWFAGDVLQARLATEGGSMDLDAARASCVNPARLVVVP